ncbi:MAG: filamentous hemagglutinin N-terminal domain-containing protein [Cyanobacteria bacterium P01_F01_bin.143]
MKQRLSLSLLLSLSYCIFSQGIFLSSAARGADLFEIAQVIPDNTTNTTVDVNGSDFTINQGDRAGNNLFHSFNDFSVPTNGSAFFNNSADIVNIFSRVTGGNTSNIDGLLGANGTANLYLINPAGIIFGEGARLDIGGSFFGSTADSIIFDDGELSATDLANPPLITINAPIGLSFRDNPRDITNRSVADDIGLQVSLGKNITLVGGNINLEAGKLTAPSGIINLGGLSTTGEIKLNSDGNIGFPNDISAANVTLSNQAEVKVRSSNGGAININANQLQLTEESLLAAGIEAESGFPGAQADNITIEANNIVASGNSEIRNENLGIGNAGNINITTETLDFTEKSAIVTSNFQQGNAGNVNIHAIGDISFNGESGGIWAMSGFTRQDTFNEIQGVVGDGGDIIVTANNLSLNNNGHFESRAAGIGDSGNITVNTGNLFLNDGAIATNSSGMGDAGNIILNVSDTVSLNQINNFSILILAQVSGQGNAGNIEINTGNLVAKSQDQSAISLLLLTDHRGGIGNSGNITIDATDSISFDKTVQLSNAIPSNVVGNAGTIQIKANSLSVNGSLIQANTSGQGNAGDIIIEANDFSLDQEGLILSQVLGTANGQGGEISITSENIILKGRSFVSTNTQAEAMGNAGNIILNADIISIIEDSAFDSITNNEFDSGNITITTRMLEIASGGDVNVSTFNKGNAGSLTINASELIFLTGLPDNQDINDANRSGLSTNSLISNGNSGDINIVTNQLIISDGGTIEAGNFVDFGGPGPFPGTGEPGNIIIQANSINLSDGARIQTTTQSPTGNDAIQIDLKVTDNITLRNDSFISARAFENADGGNISINAKFIIAFPNGNNDILASAQRGEGGNIIINTEALFGIQERPLNDRTNDINASSEFGLDGAISIFTPDINSIQTEINLPNSLIESEQTVGQVCQRAPATEEASGLTVTGKGGIPRQPFEPFNSETLLVDEIITTRDRGSASGAGRQANYPELKPIQTNIGNIYPARGIFKTEDGKIILTAYATENLNSRKPYISANCGIN